MSGIELKENMHRILNLVSKYYTKYSAIITDRQYDTFTGLHYITSCNPIYILDARPYYFGDMEETTKY